MRGRFARILRVLALLALGYLVASILAAGRRTLHGNQASFVFHEPGCRFYDAKNCTEVFSTAESAIEAGYEPARCCHS